MKYFDLLLTSVLIFSLSCNNNSEETYSVAAPVTSPNYVEDFSPAYFEEDDRVEKIKALAPKVQELIEAHAEERHIPGIAYGIVVDNQLVLSGATGISNLAQEIEPDPQQTVFRIASMTKSFTAMAILKLRDEGKLSLEDPISKFIPETAALTYATKDAPTINVEHLLTMTAGFPEDNPWGDRQLHEPDSMLIGLINSGISFSNPSGYSFEYSNTGYAMLGMIVAKVSGMPYQDYIRAEIFEPLGMENTYWEYDRVPDDQLAIGYRREDEEWQLEPMLHDGAYGAMGGLMTTIEDFSKYVQFHLSAWPPRNDEETGPVKRSSVREMHQPQFPRLIANAKDWNDEDCPVISGYGYGLGISKNCKGTLRVSHGGALPGFGSNYVFYPELGIGLMAFCNLTYTSPWPYEKLIKLIFEEVDPKERTLPPSRLLMERQEQVVQLIQTWDETLGNQILAENFFLDKSREKRMEETAEYFDKAGEIKEVELIKPSNQLRGEVKMNAENGTLWMFFTLSPETHPKVQAIYLDFEAK